MNVITVHKGTEYKKLREWKRSNAPSPQNIRYDNLDGVVRWAMLKKLIEEQGGLCAYTMKPITSSGGGWQAHIEHILPISNHPGQSVEWDNLLACVPQPGVACDYGAVRKGAYDPTKDPFVNPTRGGVSTQFRFRDNGLVDGLTPDAVATASAAVLNLNHTDLVNDRRSKIKGALERKPTASDALRRAQALRKPDRNGNLEPYCEAVAQVLENYAQRLGSRAGRVAGAIRP